MFSATFCVLFLTYLYHYVCLEWKNRGDFSTYTIALWAPILIAEQQCLRVAAELEAPGAVPSFWHCPELSRLPVTVGRTLWDQRYKDARGMIQTSRAYGLVEERGHKHRITTKETGQLWFEKMETPGRRKDIIPFFGARLLPLTARRGGDSS